MKKIISALTLGAMVAGAAFADVSINLNFRQRANLFASSSEYTKLDKSEVKATKQAFFTDAYSGSGTDNLAISMSGDIVSFDMQWVADASKTAEWRAKGLNASVFLGPVTVFGGLWADGKQNGAYRNKVLIDAGNFEGMDFEWHKIGSGFKNVPDNWIDNMVGAFGNLPENYAAGVTYKVPVDNGALSLNAAYITNEKSSTKNASIAWNNKGRGHTFSFVADGRIDGVASAELAVKYGDWINPNKDKEVVPAIGAGLYVQPVTIKNLFTTIGGSIGMVDGNFEDYSAELRLHYVVKPNKFTVTSFHSFQALTDAENFKKDYSGSNDTIRTLADVETSATNGGLNGKFVINRDQILSNNLGLRYFVTPNLAVTGIVADFIGMGDNMGEKVDDMIMQLRCSAWAQFYADKNNSIAIGFVYAINDVTDKFGVNCTTMGIPVIFRVKM